MGRTYEDGLGGHITIHEDGDATTPMRFTMLMPKGFGPPAPESHPSQREDFRILRGVLDLGMVDGEHVVLHEGDTFTLPAGVYHLPANGGEGELEFEAVLTPGLGSAAMFGSLYSVTRAHSGLAQLARVAMTFREHREVIRFRLPVRAMMSVIAAFARAFGVRRDVASLPEPSPSRSA